MENRIKEFRARSGLTLQQLADRVGTSNQQISRLERGQIRLSTDWLVKLASALGCEPADLIGRGTGASPVEAEDGVLPIGGDEHRLYWALARQLFPSNPDITLWRMQGTAMDLAGILPDDLLCVEMSTALPRPGAIVLAEFDLGRNCGRRPRVRCFMPPYLVSESSDRSLRRPVIYDGGAVEIKGAVRHVFRTVPAERYEGGMG